MHHLKCEHIHARMNQSICSDHFLGRRLEGETLADHLFNNGSHFSLGQVVALIFVPGVENVAKFAVLLSRPLPGSALLHICDAKRLEEVLSHDSKLIEGKHAVLVCVVLLKEFFEALDNFLLFFGSAFGVFFDSFVNEFVELNCLVRVNRHYRSLCCLEQVADACTWSKRRLDAHVGG